MKKILTAREYIENTQNATIESYIEYLKEEENIAISAYIEQLSEEKNTEETNETLNTINNLMKSIENNVAMLLVEKMNELKADAILNANDMSIIEEIESLLEILKSTGMKNLPEEFKTTMIAKAEEIISTLKTIKESETQITEKQAQIQFLEKYKNASELFRRATILNDGLLISCFGSLAEPAKPFAEAEDKRLTQITKMDEFMRRLEAIQKEYEEEKESATSFWDKQKKAHKEKLKSIMERYNATLQEAVKYFQCHPELLCIAHSDDQVEHPTIENFDDLKKATGNQRLSAPSRSDFMEVKDEFNEDELGQAIVTVRELNKYIFQFEQGEDGFYRFALNTELREQLIAAQKLITKYFKMVYDRREEREQLIKSTPQLSDENWKQYNAISKILGFSPSTTDQLITGIYDIQSDIFRLRKETAEHKERFIALCVEHEEYPQSFAETIDEHADIEELYYVSKKSKKEAKQKAKTNQ